MLDHEPGRIGQDRLELGSIERVRAVRGKQDRRKPLQESPPVFGSTEEVINELRPSEPVFCIDSQELRRSAFEFRPFPGRVLYAVKCNPDPYILSQLYESGICDFDVASLQEIEQIGSLFGSSAGMYFNNPAKTRPAIRSASSNYGIRFYTTDCLEEIDKIAAEASSDDDLVIAVRLATAAKDARYTLTTKFGAPSDEAVSLLRRIDELGIRAGISFHVGSQCTAASSFTAALKLCKKVMVKAGVPIRVLNVGGGFPAPYPGERLEPLNRYFSNIMSGFRDLETGNGCVLLCEPGRRLVASAGALLAQVVVRRGNSIVLNDGVFGTLQELVNPAERRPVRLIRPSGNPSRDLMKFKTYGPTCDSNDVLGAPFLLPSDTREGDWIEIGMMGAYSLSMRTHFNGFYANKVVRVENPRSAQY